MPDHAPPNSTTPASSPAPSAAGQDIAPIVRSLERIRARAWVLLVISALAGVAGIAAAVFTGVSLADFYLRTPSTIRGGLLIVGLLALWSLLRSRVGPAIGFRPSLTEIALRIEKTPQGRSSGLAGTLASGLELAPGVANPAGVSDATTDRQRASQVVQESLNAFARSPAARSILKPSAAWRAVALAAAMAVPGLLLAAWRPTLAVIALERMLTPWTGAAWPKRTLLADITGVKVHSSQASLPVRAVVKHESSQTPDVWIRYRTIVDGRAGSWRSDLLTPQGKRVRSIDGALEGDLVERLIEPGAGAAVSSAASNIEIEYRFQSTDDQTAAARIRLVDPPVVLRSEVAVTPPSYASAAPATGAAAFVSGPQQVFEGAAIAAIGPVLSGSRVTIQAALNKPVGPPPGGAGSMFVGPSPRDAKIVAENGSWTITFTADASMRVLMLPQDEFGISSPSESVVAFTVLSDQPPTASVLTPSQDEGVLPTATLPVEGEGRDDVALEFASLEYQIASAAAGSQGASQRPADPVTLLRSDAASTGAPLGVQARVSSTLELATLGVKPGDEIVLTSLAKDIYQRDGEQHEAVRSSGRRLLVISEAQLVEQVQNELAAVRDAAIRLDRDQEELIRKAQQQTAGQRVGTQRSLTQRLTPPEELVQRLAQRVERNGLADQAMTGMLSDAAETLKAAAQASEQAAQALSQADRKTAAGEDPVPDNAAAAQQQKQVRDELASLVGMLDRGQDGWTVRREVQRLLDQQRELTEQTREATQTTAGKTADSLTAAEREKLAGLAQKQQELSARTQEAIDQLEQRAQALEKTDPGQSAAMKQAAQQGRDQKVPASQRQAAQAITENRSQSANELQQKAAQAMQQMLERFDQSQKQRDDALRRVLAELADQIEALIAQQKTQLQALAAAGAKIPAPQPGQPALDAPMITLHGATLGLADSVAQGPPALRAVADPIEAAGGAQAQAIQELRKPEPAVEATREHEQASLESLNQALELSRKMEQQAQQKDQGRQRNEILEAYRAALEEQTAISADSAPLIGKPLDRRQRATARALGEREDSLRATLAELRKKNTEIESTVVFSYAHDQIDGILGRVAEALKAGAASKVVGREQDAALNLIKSLVQAMASSQQEDPFREGADDAGGDEQGGGGGPGGASSKPKLIPEVAELQGLRGLQDIAMKRTRAASDAGTDVTGDELADVQRFQRDIADRAKKLLDRINNPTPGGPAKDEVVPAPGSSADPPAPEPPDTAPAPAPDEPKGGGS